MSNKFLDLNSINVIKDYIDKTIRSYNNDGLKSISVNAYAYVKDGDEVPPISGGNFDPTYASVSYPEGWDTLDNVIENIKDDDGNLIELVDALAAGSIYMSVGVISIDNSISSWSTPMKVSGQNGQDGASFKFSYTIDGEFSEDVLTLENTDGKREIYFIYKPAGSEQWSVPTIWAKYTTDGQDGVSGTTTLYRYGISRVTDVDEEDNLIPPSIWVKNILNIGLSKEYPYLWMKSISVPADEVDNVTESYFDTVEPILFSAWGLDGNVPNYTLTLYRQGKNLEGSPESTPGISKPEPPTVDAIDKSLEKFLTDNSEWKMLPDDDGIIWWQCGVQINGQTEEVINDSFTITRYNTLNREAVPGQYTITLYRWSDTQNQPPLIDPDFNPFDESFVYVEGMEWKPDGWNENPDEGNPDMPEQSLWMISAFADGVNPDYGYPMLKTPWSAPVRISGPRGPIAYDYRMEYRYMNGTAEMPSNVDGTWFDDPGSVALTSDYPYLWARQYLTRYIMKYADNGETIVQVSDTPEAIIKTYSYYRVSGLNGNNGNTKNNLKYSTSQEEIEIKSFIENNLFVANSDNDIMYVINYNIIDFSSGYTAKFANIGTGNVIIKTTPTYKFVNGSTEVEEFTLSNQERVEIVCHKGDNDYKFLVIGKSL